MVIEMKSLTAVDHYYVYYDYFVRYDGGDDL